jgi:hypothetical protein
MSTLDGAPAAQPPITPPPVARGLSGNCLPGFNFSNSEREAAAPSFRGDLFEMFRNGVKLTSLASEQLAYNSPKIFFCAGVTYAAAKYIPRLKMPPVDGALFAGIACVTYACVEPIFNFILPPGDKTADDWRTLVTFSNTCFLTGTLSLLFKLNVNPLIGLSITGAAFEAAHLILGYFVKPDAPAQK